MLAVGPEDLRTAMLMYRKYPVSAGHPAGRGSIFIINMLTSRTAPICQSYPRIVAPSRSAYKFHTFPVLPLMSGMPLLTQHLAHDFAFF
jgi:hypothetical protein